VKKQPWLFGILLTILVGCADDDAADTSATPATGAIEEPNVATEVTHVISFETAATAFQQAAQQSVKAMLAQCSVLQADISAFLNNAADDTQEKARQSFRTCYQAWVQSSLYFQLPFELSEKKDFDTLTDLIDTRPFLPGYIDGIPEYPFSGLVHELDMPVNANNLKGQHRLMDEESASVGFPVIEFFLWKIPAEEHWLDNGENTKVVERRRDYLNTATELLMEHLTNAVLRWSDDNGFAKLPERAQLSFVLKSLQRLTMVELLAGHFGDAALEEPEWHHAALLSGNGRDYPVAKLTELNALLADPANTGFTEWLSKITDAPVTAEELTESLAATSAAMQKLPSNYPFETTADENWQATRQTLAQLSLYFSELSQHFDVSIVTE
jgi:hypothetical protein